MLETYAQQQHLLAMIEAAQRAGRTESEIVAIVDQYSGADAARDCGLATERNFLRRLLGRGTAKSYASGRFARRTPRPSR